MPQERGPRADINEGDAYNETHIDEQTRVL